MKLHHTTRRPLLLPIMAVAIALFALACGGGSPEATSTPEVRSTDPTAGADDGGGAAAPAFDFPTGEAVLVAADYTHPDDHVDNTGLSLPVNGKPTVVFVDAIW